MVEPLVRRSPYEQWILRKEDEFNFELLKLCELLVEIMA